MTWPFWNSDAGFLPRPMTRRGRYCRAVDRYHPACALAIEVLEDRCLLSGGINEFGSLATPPGPQGITTGPDGNLWFTENGADRIGVMATDGTLLREVPVTAGGHPWSITAGSNDYVWFTENGSNQIGRINVNTNHLDEYPIHSFYTTDSQPMGITADAAGQIWFAKSNARSLGIINPADLTMCEIRLFADPFNYYYPHEITLGPDGRLWFTGSATYSGSSGSFVGWISGDCSGSHAFWGLGFNPSYQGITAGPDGMMWVAESNANAIGHLNSDGSFLNPIPIPTAHSQPRQIITGPDGSLWFTEYGVSQIGRVTFADDGSATITEYPTPTPDSGPLGITVGSDGNIWFTENRANQIGQVVLDTNPLTATGLSLTATTGAPFVGIVASFSDSDPTPGQAANYSAVIDWGDGSSTSSDGINDNGGGNFDVIGSHTYAQAGSYTVTVTITDNDTDHDIGGVTTTVYTTIDVADPGAPGRHRNDTLSALATALRTASNSLPIFPLPATSRPAAPLLVPAWASEWSRPPDIARMPSGSPLAADASAIATAIQDPLSPIRPELFDLLSANLAL